MRMRNKKNADLRLANCGRYLIDTNSVNPPFDNGNPVHLEIGCGKGGFISKTAAANPDINFIAMESNKNVLVLAAEKAMAAELTNVRFILADASELLSFFSENCIDTIYLNFSDPWHKARHEKRRLTHGGFLELYKRVLTKSGVIRMKTDNVELFDYSLQSLRDNGFTLFGVTYDLHSEAEKDNIMTEYEELFSADGKKICRVIAALQPSAESLRL